MIHQFFRTIFAWSPYKSKIVRRENKQQQKLLYAPHSESDYLNSFAIVLISCRIRHVYRRPKELGQKCTSCIVNAAPPVYLNAYILAAYRKVQIQDQKCVYPGANTNLIFWCHIVANITQKTHSTLCTHSKIARQVCLGFFSAFCTHSWYAINAASSRSNFIQFAHIIHPSLRARSGTAAFAKYFRLSSRVCVFIN